MYISPLPPFPYLPLPSFFLPTLRPSFVFFCLTTLLILMRAAFTAVALVALPRGAFGAKVRHQGKKNSHLFVFCVLGRFCLSVNDCLACGMMKYQFEACMCGMSHQQQNVLTPTQQQQSRLQQDATNLYRKD